MQTLFGNDSYVYGEMNDSLINSDLDKDVAEKQANELFFIHSRIKKLEYYKEQIVESLKDYMKRCHLNEIENSNGKIKLYSSIRNQLDKRLLIELGVDQEMLDLATREIAIEQLRITVR